MAHKIKEGLRDIKESVVEKLKGPKYHNNLLGESLIDLMRKATSKTLAGPDEETNAEVVETINQEITNGRDAREVVTLLKQRLSMDNPTKQWLAVLLVKKVLHGCRNVLGLHQEEILQEVAKVMARPAKPDTEMGRRARQAAKELLREFGRAGADAFRAANRGYNRAPPGSFEAGLAVHCTTGVPVAHSTHPTPVPGLSVEASSLVQELRGIMDQARANAELLNELLRAHSDPQAADEFEKNLIADLAVEVRELRGLLTAYLEQLQSHEGEAVELVLAEALGLSDTLDAVLDLDKKRPAGGPKSPTASGSGSSSTPAAAAALPEVNLIDAPLLSGPSPPQAPAQASASGSQSMDLISFDVEPPAPAAAVDPFAIPPPAMVAVAAPHLSSFTQWQATSLPPDNMAMQQLYAALPVQAPVLSYGSAAPSTPLYPAALSGSVGGAYPLLSQQVSAPPPNAGLYLPPLTQQQQLSGNPFMESGPAARSSVTNSDFERFMAGRS